jgi:hypothetical protein
LIENNGNTTNENSKSIVPNEGNIIQDVSEKSNDEKQEEHEQLKHHDNEDEFKNILTIARAGEESKEKRISNNQNRLTLHEDSDTNQSTIENGKHKLSSYSVNQDKEKIKKLDKGSNNSLEIETLNDANNLIEESSCDRPKITNEKFDLNNDEITENTSSCASDNKNVDKKPRKSNRAKSKK